MYKISLTLVLATLFVLNGYSQKDTLSRSDKAALDSMIKNDEFLKLLDKTSTVDISIGSTAMLEPSASFSQNDVMLGRSNEPSN